MIQAHLRPLSELLPQTFEPGISREPVPGFYAEFRGKVWLVKAVLERTAVLQDTENFYERRLGKLSEVLVDPAVISWRSDSGGRFTDGGQPDPAGRSKLRGRASLITTNAKNVEARKRGNVASQQPRGANQGQRRWNGHADREEMTEADFLRARGKARCPGCGEIVARRALASTVCSPCQSERMRQSREKEKGVA